MHRDGLQRMRDDMHYLAELDTEHLDLGLLSHTLAQYSAVEDTKPRLLFVGFLSVINEVK